MILLLQCGHDNSEPDCSTLMIHNVEEALVYGFKPLFFAYQTVTELLQLIKSNEINDQQVIFSFLV